MAEVRTSSQLDALKAAWQARWQAMAPRERQLITAAAWLVGLTLLVLIGVRPAWRTLNDTPGQLRAIESQLGEIRRMAQDTQMLRQRPAVPPMQAEAALRSATERLGEAAKLSLQGDRAVLTLVDVPGEALATWLQESRGVARTRPLEANLQQGANGTYSGTILVALSVPTGN